MQMILERESGSKSRLLRAPKTIHPCSIRIRPLNLLTAEPPRVISFSARRPIDTVAAAQPSAQLQRSNALAGLRKDGNEVMVPLICQCVGHFASELACAHSPTAYASSPKSQMLNYVFSRLDDVGVGLCVQSSCHCQLEGWPEHPVGSFRHCGRYHDDAARSGNANTTRMLV